MDLPRTLTLVNYAVNGAGLGHVTRLSALNRWLRRYASFAGVRTQHWFLTTSEADSWLFAEGFAAFKLPSKSIVERAGIPKLSYLALAKQWVWNTVALLRPDLFIVDTFPNGSFDELAPVLDLCRTKALVLRPVRSELAARPAFRAAAQLYDRIVVPGALPEPALPRARQVGPVMLTERFEAWPRAEARARMGVSGEDFTLLVTGGGGGDEGVARVFEALAEVCREATDVHLVFAAGPLYRGPVRRGARITWWTEPHLAEIMPGLDGAFAAGGYNTAHELAFFGVPAALFAQEKVADDQAARVTAFAEAGAALLVPPPDRDLAAARAALRQLRDPAHRARASAAGRSLVPHNEARKAAAQLLSLALPASVVRQAEEQCDEALLSALATWRRDPSGVSPFAETADEQLTGVVDLAVALQGRGPLDRASLELDAAVTLAEAARRAGAPLAEVVRLAQVLARGANTTATPADEWVEDAAALVGHAGVGGQWPQLNAAIAASASDRARTPGELARQWVRLLDTQAAAGKGLLAFMQERSVRGPGEARAPRPESEA